MIIFTSKLALLTTKHDLPLTTSRGADLDLSGPAIERICYPYAELLEVSILRSLSKKKVWWEDNKEKKMERSHVVIGIIALILHIVGIVVAIQISPIVLKLDPVVEGISNIGSTAKGNF